MKSALYLIATIFTMAVVGPAQQHEDSGMKRLYIEERVKNESGGSAHCDKNGNCWGHNTSQTHNVSLDVTREVMKRCPSAITVTDNREAADYILRVSPGASTLYRQNGDAVYVSPTRWKASNLAKDVCNFVLSKH